MSYRDDAVYLGDMLDAARKALVFVEGKDQAAFDTDEILQLALTHLVQIIGEAARRVSQPTRDNHPGIAWSEIAGMRNKIVHDYDEIHLPTLWRTIQNDLPPLIVALEKIVPPDEPQS